MIFKLNIIAVLGMLCTVAVLAVLDRIPVWASIIIVLSCAMVFVSGLLSKRHPLQEE